MSHVHVLDPAAQPESADQSAACVRRRALPAAPRGVREQDLEEHLAVRPRRPPRLRARAGHSLRLRRDGVRQQLRVPGLEHGHDEDRAICVLTTRPPGDSVTRPAFDVSTASYGLFQFV